MNFSIPQKDEMTNNLSYELNNTQQFRLSDDRNQVADPSSAEKTFLHDFTHTRRQGFARQVFGGWELGTNPDSFGPRHREKTSLTVGILSIYRGYSSQQTI